MISIDITKRVTYGLLFIIIMWFSTSLSSISFHILYVLIFLICIIEMIKITKDKNRILGLTYILIPMIIIHLFDTQDYNNTLHNEYNNSLLLFIYTLTWTFDTFAYLFGTRFGRHKLLPSISPKKSWEGFFGGAFITIITALLITNMFENLNQYNTLIISIFLPITATIGDLVASSFKRAANMKDFGNLIPGHGGVIDRMDSFMITIPAIYLYIQIIA